MSPLIDQAARERFLKGAERNFSVIAPAGVGKTTAIVRRIADIARHDAQRETPLLPHLVVVTYTSKAAQELQDRARQALLSDAGVDERVLRGFNRAFFGTIHSFCLELLRRHGHHLGLTPGLRLIEDDTALWNRFLRAQDSLSELIPSLAREDYLRLMPLGKVLALVRKGVQGKVSPPSIARPTIDLEAVLACEAKGRSAETIKRSQEALRSWANALEGDARALEIPQPQSKAREFNAAWAAALQPLQNWLAGHTLAFAQAVGERYRAYRIEHGQLTYDDMIALSEQLLQHPRALAEVRARRSRIILDEAQDTDPVQFRILTALACPEGEYGAWPGTGTPPRGGHFCMVGDPQQAIYSQRADLDTYLAVHEALTEDSNGEALTFEVTMRCDQAVVAAVNASFPEVLDGSGGQVSLVPLESRPGAGSGCVERLELQPEGEITGKTDRLQAEADALAQWLSQHRPGDLGVATWGDVALLAPRKDALDSLEQALLRQQLPVQNHGRKALRGDDPAFAWVAATLYVLAHPADHFELFGLLREVFTLNDGEMAQAVSEARAAGGAHPLQLEARSELPGELGAILNRLHGLRLRCLQLPLREAFEAALEETQLLARLAALPEARLAEINQSLAGLRLEATLAEAEGLSLAAFAKRLCAQASAGPSETAAEPDKLQLMTCLKAKGLEWPVVIVPFFFSPIVERSQHYPQLFQPPGKAATLAISACHDISAARARHARILSQSYARLLYVTLTRARNRLILVDDHALFPHAKGSFADHLQVQDGQANAPWWAGLQPYQDSVQAFSAQDKATAEVTLPALPADSDRAPLAPNIYPRRVLPSSLAHHGPSGGHHRDESDLRSEPSLPEVAAAAAARQGADYGNWWHLTMETLPWAAPVDAWRKHAQGCLNQLKPLLCERGSKELERFFGSDLAARLSSHTWTIRAELPVFWPDGTGVVYDGLIDLTARHEDGHILVVDWKTDLLGEDGLAGLQETYAPQLDCYRRALADLFSAPVEALLYSTRAAASITL